MLPLSWTFSPPSWTTATAEGYGDICLGGFLPCQNYRSVCVYVHVYRYPSPLHCTAYSRGWFLPRASRNVHHHQNIQIHSFSWGSVRLPGLKKWKKNLVIFIISTLLSAYKWIVSSPHTKLSRENYCLAWGAFLAYLSEKPVPILMPQNILVIFKLKIASGI